MRKFLPFIFMWCYLISSAQIGYQLTLLNSATGEARANETVNVELTLTNNEQEVIYKETQRATTDDFGILSLTVGSSSTFSDVDWNKLPFFVAAKVDGTLIGKQQILSVPIAEYAKTCGPMITMEDLVNYKYEFRCSDYTYTYFFYEDGTGTNLIVGNDWSSTYSFKYILEHGEIFMYWSDNPDLELLNLRYSIKLDGLITSRMTRGYSLKESILMIYRKTAL